MQPTKCQPSIDRLSSPPSYVYHAYTALPADLTCLIYFFRLSPNSNIAYLAYTYPADLVYLGNHAYLTFLANPAAAYPAN